MYPFIGAFYFFKWFFMGFGTSIIFIITTILEIILYAFKGVFHLFITIPKNIFIGYMHNRADNSLKKKEEKRKIEAQNLLKENAVASVKNNVPLKTVTTFTKQPEIPQNNLKNEEKISLAQHIQNNNKQKKDILNNNEDTSSMTNEQKKQIMKEKQAKYKQEQKEKKERAKALKKVNAKLQAEKELLMNDLASGEVKRTDRPVAFR